MTSDLIMELIQRVADEVINPRFQQLTSAQIDQKKPGDYVTIADKEAEVAITDQLKAWYPKAQIIGEEAVFADPQLLEGIEDHQLAFTVDPVDGTGNFVKGDKRYAVMIAQLEFGKVVQSWIWHPQFEDAYYAQLGGGVWLNGQRLSPAERSGLIKGGSRKKWHWTQPAPDLAPLGKSNLCAGVDYPQLLAGELDYLIYQSPKPWDHLPGQLMNNELGGATLICTGEPYRASTGPQLPIVAAGTLALAKRVAQLLGSDPRLAPAAS